MSNNTKNSNAKNMLVAFFLGWLIPGMGHFYIQKRLKSFLFLFSIISLFIVGILIGGDIAWYELNLLVILGFIVKLFSGIIAVMTVILKPMYDNTPQYYEIGSALLLMAGTLNMLILVDLFEEITGKKKTEEEVQ